MTRGLSIRLRAFRNSALVPLDFDSQSNFNTYGMSVARASALLPFSPFGMSTIRG